MIDRLVLDVDEHPEDPHPVYFLHRQYALAGQWADAIDWGKHYLSMAKGKALDMCECYGNLAICYANLKQPQDAANCLHDPGSVRLSRWRNLRRWQLAAAHEPDPDADRAGPGARAGARASSVANADTDIANTHRVHDA